MVRWPQNAAILAAVEGGTNLYLVGNYRLYFDLSEPSQRGNLLLNVKFPLRH